MPVFRLRNRVEIIRQMVARVVARSALVGLTRNSAVFHILAAAADVDADIYLQLAKLRDLFSVDRATGSELDERAREIQPGTLRRQDQIFATTSVIFSRVGTVGVDLIPVGTVVAARDAQGTIQYRTTVADSIPNLSDNSGPVPVVASIAGARANVVAGEINQLITRIPNIVTVTNTSDVVDGRDRETDDRFRQRIKDFVRSLARGTVPAIVAFARNVVLSDGRRVLFANVEEPIPPTGKIFLYIDDGSGTAQQFDNTFVGGIPEEDVLIAAAVGGETTAFANQKPVVEDVALIVRLNNVAIVRGTDWEIDPARGQVELLPGSFPTGLTAGDKLAANYRFYIGLIQEVQRVITGDPLFPLTHPGVEAGGVVTIVLAATPIFQTLTANVVTVQGFDLVDIKDAIEFAITNYINNLDIGADVIVSEIIEQAMGVNGVFNFRMIELSGTAPPTDQTIAKNQVARIISNDIDID